MPITSKRFTWKSIHRKILVSLPWLRLLVVLFLVSPIPFVAFRILPQANAEGVIYVINQYQAPPSRVFTIRIQIAAAEPFSGWNIQIQANQSIINPISASISGNTLDANYTENIIETVNCVNGVNLTTSHCDSSDGLGIVHQAATARQTNSPIGSVYGLLVTINYTVVLAGLFSPLHFLRATISNGAETVPIQSIDGFYGIPSGQDFGLKASPAMERILIGSKVNVTLTVSTSGGYHGRVDLAVLASDLALEPDLNETHAQVYPNSPRNVTLTISTSSNLRPNQYSINVTATSNGLFHSMIIEITATDMPDFALKASPPVLRIGPDADANSIIRLETQSGFSGSVDLSLDLPRVSGLTASLNPRILMISSDRSATAVLNVHTPNSTVPYLYLLNITATSTSSSSVSTLTESIEPPDPDFTFGIQTSEFEMKVGQSVTSVLTMTSINYFRGSIRLVGSTGLGTREGFSPSNISLDFGNSSKSILALTIDQKSPPGRYSIALGAIGTTASGANVTHVIVIAVTIDPPVSLATFLGLENVAYTALVGGSLLVLVAMIVRFAKQRKKSHTSKP